MKEIKKTKIEIPAGFEVDKTEMVNGALFVTFKEKERKIPKSWKEFCEMSTRDGKFFVNGDSMILNASYYLKKEMQPDVDRCLLPNRETAEAVIALCQLIQLRNCYNGDWVPDYKTADTKFTIEFENNRIVKNTTKGWPCVFVFKTEELRDMFLEFFQDLIEKLKPLYGISL